ncbi:MAG: hypothetical protein OEY52_15920 [Gammaproteobacteria bacterium]|nr:hypothetical protein [Gammaproteobacteria bacterium]
MKKLLILTSILLASACASKPELIQRIPFNMAEYAELPAKGTATVTGQAYLKTADGTIHYPKNEKARLNPVTSYSKQWYQVHYIERKSITKADPRYLEYVYKVDFDEQGRFNFNNIPEGSYYISAPIFWMEEIKMEDGSILMKRHGAFVCQEIHVKEGETLVMNITRDQTVKVATSN